MLILVNSNILISFSYLVNCSQFYLYAYGELLYKQEGWKLSATKKKDGNDGRRKTACDGMSK